MDTQLVDETLDVECGAIGEVPGKSEVTQNGSTKLCDFCLFENTEVKAVAFCIECTEQLCSNCAREHRKNKSSRHHNLLESEDIINDVSVIKTVKKMMTCPDHPEVMVTYKCEDHERYICPSCLAECHRKCIKVDEISKANHTGFKNTCTSVMETMAQKKSITVAFKEVSEERIARFERELDQLHSQKESYFNSIYEKLSKAKQKLESDIQAVSNEQIKGHERNLQMCRQALAKEQEYHKLREFTLRYGSPSEINVIPDLIMAEANFPIMTFETEDSKKELSLTFETVIDINVLENVGKISLLHHGEKIKPDHESALCLSSEEVVEAETTSKGNKISVADPVLLKCNRSTQTEENQSISLMKRNIKPDRLTYSVRCQGDSQLSEIYSIVILPDERVALIDNSNCMMKVLDEHFSFLFAMNFVNDPTDMCHVFDATVAVICDNVRAVTFYDIGKTCVTHKGSFQTKFEIVAVAKFGDNNKIAVLFRENETLSIQIRDTGNGRILHKFNCKYSPGEDFDFEEGESNRMVCRGENDVLLSEYWKVHCFSSSLNKSSIRDWDIPQLWFFKCRRGNFCKDISDLATDEEGNIYVCGSESHNVHQISANDYRINREIVTNIKLPLSVAVNSKKGYIIIGCECDDFIHVYHFC